MGTVLAHPRPQSYCTEWSAAKFVAAEGVNVIKLLLKGTPWSIFSGTLQGDESYIVATDGHNQFWRINPGDWVIRSPHDKVWFMSHGEFESQFTWVPEQ